MRKFRPFCFPCEFELLGGLVAFAEDVLTYEADDHQMRDGLLTYCQC